MLFHGRCSDRAVGNGCDDLTEIFHTEIPGAICAVHACLLIDVRDQIAVFRQLQLIPKKRIGGLVSGEDKNAEALPRFRLVPPYPSFFFKYGVLQPSVAPGFPDLGFKVNLNAGMGKNLLRDGIRAGEFFPPAPSGIFFWHIL